MRFCFLSDPVPYNIMYTCIATYLDEILFKPNQREGSPFLAYNDKMRSLLLSTKTDINFGHVKILCDTVFIGFVLSYTDK